MCSIDEMVDRIDKINPQREVEKSFNDNHEAAEQLIRVQLNHGVRGDGLPIVPEYTPLTKFLKAQKGQPFDRVTLYDEGNFYRGIEIKASGETIESLSHDSKMDKLVGKYGESILSLLDESKDRLWVRLMQPQVVQSISEQTGMT